MAHRWFAHFRRRLFTILSVVSLILCLATIALWVGSYWREDALTLTRASPIEKYRKVFQIRSSCGGVRITYDRDRMYYLDSRLGWRHDGSPSSSRTYPYWFAGSPQQKFKMLGFQLFVADWTDSGGPKRSIGFLAPWFAIALVLSVLPSVWLFAMLRSRRRARAGLCPRCGYDLRATPERFPECGTAAIRA